jgi:hypothetical protein
MSDRGVLISSLNTKELPSDFQFLLIQSDGIVTNKLYFILIFTPISINFIDNYINNTTNQINQLLDHFCNLELETVNNDLKVKAKEVLSNEMKSEQERYKSNIINTYYNNCNYINNIINMYENLLGIFEYCKKEIIIPAIEFKPDTNFLNNDSDEITEIFNYWDK